MKTFFDRTPDEQAIIREAYNFEIRAIKKEDSSSNPLFETVKTMENGDEVWDAINLAVELACN